MVRTKAAAPSPGSGIPAVSAPKAVRSTDLRGAFDIGVDRATGSSPWLFVPVLLSAIGHPGRWVGLRIGTVDCVLPDISSGLWDRFIIGNAAHLSQYFSKIASQCCPIGTRGLALKMNKRRIRRIDVHGNIVEEEVDIDPVEEQRNLDLAALQERARVEKASEAALSDPELMRLWGEINFIWDEIEHMLWIAFDAMLEADPFASRAVFFSQKAHAARRSMVEELSEQYFRFRDSKHQRALKNSLRRVKARSDTRNLLAHGVWGWRTDGANLTMEVVRFTSEPHFSAKPKMYDKSDLLQARNSMRDTMIDLSNAIEPMRIAKIKSFIARNQLKFSTINERFEGIHPLTWPWVVE